MHSNFVGSSEHGSTLVHNGQGDYIKKPAVPTKQITSRASKLLASTMRQLGPRLKRAEFSNRLCPTRRNCSPRERANPTPVRRME